MSKQFFYNHSTKEILDEIGAAKWRNTNAVLPVSVTEAISFMTKQEFDKKFKIVEPVKKAEPVRIIIAGDPNIVKLPGQHAEYEMGS